MTDREMDLLIKDANIYSGNTVKGMVTGKNEGYSPHIRECEIAQIPLSKCKNTPVILQSILLESYANIYDQLNYFKVSDFVYTLYEVGGHFKRHHDVIKTSGDVRVLSMSINLSDEHSYDGGDLLLYKDYTTTSAFERLERSKGSYIIFPSFLHHEVTKVTKGRREAIITWFNDTPLSLKSFKDHYQSIA